MTLPFDRGASLRQCLDAIPSYVLLVDDDARILDHNRAAEGLLGARPTLELRRLCGDVLACVQARLGHEMCGRTEPCADCVVRGALRQSAATGQVVRATAPMRLHDGHEDRATWFLVTASPLRLPELAGTLLILDDATELHELRGVLPICASCGKVRDDEQLWQDARAYVRRYTRKQVVHGLCPGCVRELYPD
jgi:PAS domain-containing protein